MPAEKKLGEIEVLFSRDKCPLCGSEHAVYKDTVAQEVAAGRFSQEMADMGVGTISAGLVIDPTKNVLTAPQISIVKDVCLNPDCGAEYVSKIIRVRVQVSVKMGSQQSFRPGQPGPGYQMPPMRG